jgi:hypothetical protein
VTTEGRGAKGGLFVAFRRSFGEDPALSNPVPANGVQILLDGC